MSMIREGARVILPDRVAEVSVRVDGGRIAALDGPRDGAMRIDGRGLFLAPALVDVHGDAFERQIMPRPNVFFPLDGAVLETDRQLAANGIATAYHALTLSWEPGLRSVARGTSMVHALSRLSARMSVENRVQLRWETFCPEALPLIREAMAGPLGPSLAFNDHTSMILLDPEVPLQQRPFEQSPDFPISAWDHPVLLARMKSRANRCEITESESADRLRAAWERRPEVPGWIAEAASAGRAAGAPMLSHDDTQLETRGYFRDLGARISEFPMTLAVARAAREAGDMIVFGAPNAVRGGSHIGSPGPAEMVSEGLCDILASDYHYPAMIEAVARLTAERRGPLHALWKLISTNPARASHLYDRGEIAPGQRADLVLLDWPEGSVPSVRMTMSNGRLAYAAMPSGIRADETPRHGLQTAGE